MLSAQPLWQQGSQRVSALWTPKLLAGCPASEENTLVFLTGGYRVTSWNSSRSDERLGRPSYQTWFPLLKFLLDISYQALLALFLGHTLCSFQGDHTAHPRAWVTSLGQGAHKTSQPEPLCHIPESYRTYEPSDGLFASLFH